MGLEVGGVSEAWTAHAAGSVRRWGGRVALRFAPKPGNGNYDHL